MVKTETPAPVPEKPAVQSRPGTLSLFGAPKKVEKKETPAPAPKKPVAKSRSGTFSLFGAPKKVEKKEPPKVVDVEPKRSATFSLFGGTKPVVEKPAEEVVEVPKKSGTFSLFGGAPKKAAPVKKVAPAVKKTVAKKVVAKKAVKKAAKISAPAGVPTLARWTQNADGSVTGFISGSPNFRKNTKITTSPIKGKASVGAVVQTGSGSKYFLS